MSRRRLLHGSLIACLVFSGFAALVYQIVWTRLLGLSFGTTSEAIATVLAVFFGGLALGNLLAARRVQRVERPLLVYGVLELAIGLTALAAAQVLQGLDGAYAALVAGRGALATAALRLAISCLVLLPPTIAMGATLPVVTRGLVAQDATLGRWSGLLYGANTLGAVAGAYLTGFWLLPELGLAASVLVGAGMNLAAAALVLAIGGSLRAIPAEEAEVAAERGSGHAGTRAAFLLFFGVSGFVAIGYEIVWSKLFGIVMEGTIYGFSAVLAAYLLGIALGSTAIAWRVDRIGNPARVFGLLHLAIAASVAAGMAAVPYLPHALAQLARWSGGGDAVHLLFLLAAPIVLVPTALFGAAFPLVMRLYARSAAQAGEGMGLATAINTAGSILASLLVGLWLVPAAGLDATLYLLLLLEVAVVLLVLARFQPGAPRERLAAAAFAAAAGVAVLGGFGGTHVEQALAGRQLGATSLADYQRRLGERERTRTFLAEGKTAIVAVYETARAREMHSNGMPEANLAFEPPYRGREAVLLGTLPYLLAERAERALVVGLGGANTVDGLTRTALREIDVVELEPAVVDAVRVLYEGRANPIDDPRVRVRIGDGRHELLLGARGRREGYDVIASQPSHPWLAGAASLFTEEYFALARENLRPGGVFAVWLNGFRTDADSVLAVLASFERVFPGSILLEAGSGRPRESLLLLGGLQPIAIDPDRLQARMDEPRLRALLALYELRSVEQMLALAEGPTAVFAALAPDASNTDDNAFLESRIPRRLDWSALDFTTIEDRLPADAPVLPPLARPVDVAGVARALFEREAQAGASEKRWIFAAKLTRLLRAHGEPLDPYLREVLLADAETRTPRTADAGEARLRALAEQHPRRPEALRALGLHLAERERAFEQAAAAFAAAHARSGEGRDAYDAGRALYHRDPRAAFAWFDRIPPHERARHPRLALYDADRAESSGLRGEAIRPAYQALLAYYQGEEARKLPFTLDVLTRVAKAAGDEQAARRFGDLADERRRSSATARLQRARSLFAAAKLPEARRAVDEAVRLAPADRGALELAVRIAHAQRDAAGVEAGLAALRALAPSPTLAVGAENRLRMSLGLSLLPELAGDTLLPLGDAPRAAFRELPPTGSEAGLASR